MKPTSSLSLAAHGRDLRIDFARGLALWFMLVDHIPHNIVALLTMRNFGFSGAIDVFVFVSGYAAAIQYGKMTLERGFVVAATRIIKRAWQLYAAHLVLFVIYISAVSWVAERYRAPDIVEEYRIIGMLNDPLRVLMHGLLLQSRPLNLDVLQLMIVLLAFFPFVLALLLRWPTFTVAGSFVLYLAARWFGLSLPAYPAGSPYLNPFCWQLLFVLSAYLALSGAKLVQEPRTVRILAFSYLAFALVVTLAARDPTLSLGPDVVTRAFIPTDRENLGPSRLLHLLAIALLFSRLVPAKWEGFQSKLLQPILKCSDEWLACFCAGVFLSSAGHFVLITSPDSELLQVLVSVTAVSMMTAVAYYVSWSKQQDRLARLGSQGSTSQQTRSSGLES